MAQAAKKENGGGAVDTQKYTNGSFQPVVENCQGCERTVTVESNTYCSAYTLPESKWRHGICNFATHVKPEITTAAVKINPLKASKRASAKKK